MRSAARVGDTGEGFAITVRQFVQQAARVQLQPPRHKNGRSPNEKMQICYKIWKLRRNGIIHQAKKRIRDSMETQSRNWMERRHGWEKRHKKMKKALN